MKVKLTFMEEALGSTPAREDLLREYIASKAPDAARTEEEVAARGVDAVADERMTVFPRLADGRPMYWDYQIKGFLKDAWQMLTRAGKAGYAGGKACAGVKAYKKGDRRVDFCVPAADPH